MFTVAWAQTRIPFSYSPHGIAVPTGIKIFNWLATMWGGKIELKTPMLFCIAFLFQFLVAGLTGVMLSAAPLDWQLGNSYFVVAHFHYVIVGGILFTLFGAFYYGSQRCREDVQRDARQAAFLLFFIGFHLTSTSCISQDCWACRGGSTPTNRVAVGTRGTSL